MSLIAVLQKRLGPAVLVVHRFAFLSSLLSSFISSPSQHTSQTRTQLVPVYPFLSSLGHPTHQLDPPGPVVGTSTATLVSSILPVRTPYIQHWILDISPTHPSKDIAPGPPRVHLAPPPPNLPDEPRPLRTQADGQPQGLVGRSRVDWFSNKGTRDHSLVETIGWCFS